MSDRVAVIENASAIRFPLVRGYHLRFDLAGSFNRVDNRLLVEFQQRRNLLLQKGEEFLVSDNAIFDHFS